LHDLAAHPHEQAKLRAELRAAAEPSKAPGLAACIQESMRLNPVAAGGSARIVHRDFAVGDGTVIRRGSQVLLYFLCIFRNERVFSQPDAYLPARWLSDQPDAAAARDAAPPKSGACKIADAILPFSAGRRNCVGQALAQAELYTTLPQLLINHSWEVVEAPTGQYGLTWKPEGLRLRAARVP
jgi:cytochrome P450